MLPIEKSCYWLASRDRYVESEPLKGQDSTDVAIVGAGFTGLWTAHFIKRLSRNKNIAVIEQGVTGYGASGRNAGILSSCIDHSHSLAKAHFGAADAERLAALGLENIRELAEFAVDCDLELSGQLNFALKESHLDDFREAAQVAEELNIHGYGLLDEEEAKREINSPLYLGALYSPGGGVINPIKLVDRLKNTLLADGVKFFERSRVKSIEGGEVITQSGRIRARKVVLATDAYSHHLFPRLLWRFIPLYDYILVSEPLTSSDRESIGWKNRQGVTDGRTFFNYYRMTADNRILWGTSDAMYYPPNRVDESLDHSERHYRELKDSFKSHFPYLSHVEFPYAWGGPIASTTRLTPFFGTMDDDRVIYGLGYTGHGIGSTRLAGKILAHMALSRRSELLNLKMVESKPFPYPPEPLRKVAVQSVTRSLKKVDAGDPPGPLLRILDALGIGFSS